jgi:hypothetical protein
VKTLAAFFVASVAVAALVPWAIEGSLGRYPFELFLLCIPFVCVFTALVGAPVYLVLRSRSQLRLVPLMLGGLLAALLSFTLFHGPWSHASFEQVGTTIYVSDDALTAAGWNRWIRQTISMSIAGAVGGLVFWTVRRLTIVGGIRESR